MVLRSLWAYNFKHDPHSSQYLLYYYEDMLDHGQMTIHKMKQ